LGLHYTYGSVYTFMVRCIMTNITLHFIGFMPLNAYV
jgi:hypothetical protein